MTNATTTSPMFRCPWAPTTATTGKDDAAMRYRVISGPDRWIADRDIVIGTSAIQFEDGCVDDGRVEPRKVWIGLLGPGSPLTSPFRWPPRSSRRLTRLIGGRRGEHHCRWNKSGCRFGPTSPPSTQASGLAPEPTG